MAADLQSHFGRLEVLGTCSLDYATPAIPFFVHYCLVLKSGNYKKILFFHMFPAHVLLFVIIFYSHSGKPSAQEMAHQ